MWEECLTVFLGEKVEGGITNIDLIRRGSNDHAFVGVSVGIHQFDAPPDWQWPQHKPWKPM